MKKGVNSLLEIKLNAADKTEGLIKLLKDAKDLTRDSSSTYSKSADNVNKAPDNKVKIEKKEDPKPKAPTDLSSCLMGCLENALKTPVVATASPPLNAATVAAAAGTPAAVKANNAAVESAATEHHAVAAAAVAKDAAKSAETSATKSPAEVKKLMDSVLVKKGAKADEPEDPKTEAKKVAGLVQAKVAEKVAATKLDEEKKAAPQTQAAKFIAEQKGAFEFTASNGTNYSLNNAVVNGNKVEFEVEAKK